MTALTDKPGKHLIGANKVDKVSFPENEILSERI